MTELTPVQVPQDYEFDYSYNRSTKDYDIFYWVDGVKQIIGSAANYHEAQLARNEAAHDYLSKNQVIQGRADAPATTR